MKRLCLCIGVCLLLWGCAASQPRQEIVATFRLFLMNVKAGDQEKILAMAPFLASLTAKKREAAVQSFRRLVVEDSQRLHMEVTRGAGETYLLRVSVSDDATGVVVPFRRNDRGQWEMSPLLEAVQHIDIVPAR